MPSTTLLAVALTAATASDASATFAQESAETPNTQNSVELTAEQLFTLSERLTLQEKTDEALIYLKALEQDTNPEYRAEARARIARIYISKGELRTATIWFQKLLDEKPNAAAVRVELAQVLAQIGDEGAAGRQLRRAASAPGIPEDVSRALGRIGANFQSNAPFGGSFQIGIAPDSNINRATQAQQVDLFGLPFLLDDDGRATQGIGLTINSTALFRQKLDKNSRLIAQIVGSGDLYLASRFNDITVSANIGPEIRSGRTSFRPALVGGRRWLGQRQLFDLYGISVSAQTVVSRHAQVTFTGGVTHLDYARRDDLTGNIYALGLAYEYAISPAFSARIAINGNRNDARAKSNSTYSGGTDLTVSRDLGSFTVFARGAYNYTQGDTPFLPFPQTRQDNFYEGQLGLVFRQISILGLSPLIRYTHSQSQSTIPLFDFQRNRVEIAVTKTF